MDGQQEAQQGAAEQVTSYDILPFAGSPEGHDIQVEHTLDVPPHVGTSQMHTHGRDEQREESNLGIGIDVALHKLRRIIRQSERYGFAVTMLYALVAASGGPATYQEVVTGQDRDRWVQAMVEEMQSL